MPIERGAIELRALALAVAVADSGSIRSVASRERVAASTVSRQLRTLEDALGVSLFERRSAGLRPTETGRRFLIAVRRLLSELEAATRDAHDAGGAIVGRLVIGTYFSASTGRFRDTLVRFLHRHPRILLLLLEGSRTELLAAVRGGHADLALLLGPDEEPGLDRRTLWQEAAMLALPAGHRLASATMVSWHDLPGAAFVTTRRGSGPEVQARVQALLPCEQAMQFHVHDVSRDGLFNLVGTGFGITALAESATGASYPGVVFRPVGNGNVPTMVEADAYWDPKRDNPALRRFLVLLRTTQDSGSRDASAD